MKLNEWFEKGITPSDYIGSMEVNQADLKHVYDNFTLPNDEDFFKNTKERNLRAIVLTEDWCGDAMLNTPILLKIAEASDIEVRMLHRDQNLELMDQYLTNGRARSIPIFIFIDENGKEVAKWGPRAEKIQAYVDESQSKLPSKETPEYEEKAKEMYAAFKKSYRNNTTFWDDVYDSIKAVLQD
ncbi:thioredoxin family protein [Oceanobacillus sp. 143]|uniref:Thioredoxin family protein n=1 Tax=Oceanobacillus zhaokaii TaxID=2052660 RepID=A0A345PIL1_9BACI|nr:thioredoxin family protein [Oceanobacillus zhaokaii]AXI09841.1 thioredoxin family protein [Oceanobacillus zhaokaii]QGS69092.1 thioredoxin family protein [Oceanobacillus sp. 143]